MKNKAHTYIRFDKLLRGLRALMLVAILLSAGGVVYHLFAVNEPAKTWMESNLDVGDGIKTKIAGFKMHEKSANHDTWVVEAERASLANDEIEMGKVKMNYVSGTRAETSFELTALKAVMDNKTQNAAFTGDVRVRTPRPVTVETDRLDWVSARRAISTDSPVRVWLNSGEITGKGFLMLLDEQSLSFNSVVRASLSQRLSVLK
jgi:LPS export ABC transporter protein LptC